MMDLQSEYNNPSAQQQSPDSDQDGDMQDLTIPAAAVGQLTQAIQQQDCATLMKILTQVISGGQGGGDNDQDGM